MNKNNKFRSGLNKYIFIALAVYHLMIIIPFILTSFLWKDVVTWYAYTLLVIDIFYLLPLIFNTYYSLEDTYLFVFQWPFIRLKIDYNDIFVIDNEFPKDVDRKSKKKYGFSKKIIVIGYYSEVLDRKEKKTKKVKKYLSISPAEYDSFMIRIGGKFSSAKKVAAKLEETLQTNEEENKKKKISLVKEKLKKAEESKQVDKAPLNITEKPKAKAETVVDNKESESKKAETEDNEPVDIVITGGITKANAKAVEIEDINDNK